MSFRNLSFWNRGFSYDRNHFGDRVAIEVYRILFHYTSDNPNCRVGAYLTKNGSSQFYSLQRIFPEFDSFIKIATTDERLVNIDMPQILKDLNGISFLEEIESVMKLNFPIVFEFESRSAYKSIFGYKFKSSIGITIDPRDIINLEGESLDSFRIQIKDYVLDVRFRNQVTLH